MLHVFLILASPQNTLQVCTYCQTYVSGDVKSVTLSFQERLFHISVHGVQKLMRLWAFRHLGL